VPKRTGQRILVMKRRAYVNDERFAVVTYTVGFNRTTQVVVSTGRNTKKLQLHMQMLQLHLPTTMLM
jgi:hypothetical protein